MSTRILVADDEPLTTEMMALMLTHRGYEVTSALDGLEALERARAECPDVILLDVMMPGMDGAQVSQILRTDPAFQEKLVVLFSCVDESEVQWRAAGADAFLQKPISVLELPRIVAELQARKATARSN